MRAAALIVLLTVNLFWAYSSLGADLTMEEVMTRPLNGQPETALVWEYFLRTPGADIYDHDQVTVQVLFRYAHNDNDVQMLTELGETYLLVPEFSYDAEYLFYEAIEGAPELSIVPTCPHWGLGMIFFQRGNLNSAIEQWELFLRNSEIAGEGEHSYMIRWSLAVIYGDSGQYGKALHHLGEFIQMAKTDSHRVLGYALLAGLNIRRGQAQAGEAKSPL